MQLSEKTTRIAVPSKGRLQEPTENLLKAAGIKYKKRDRALMAHVEGWDAVILFVRPDDIPLLVAEGAADAGFTGQDLIHEMNAAGRISLRMSLGFGHCRLALAALANGPIKKATDLNGRKIAASMAHSTREYIRKNNINAQILEVSGSVEIMVALGLADAIVDLVESGDTLRDNGLEVIETVSNSQAVLVQAFKPRNPAHIDTLARRIQGVLTAQQWTLLEYNVPRSRLKEAEAVTPGYNSPTIAATENPDLAAVKVMILKKESIDIMDRLEAIGATAILETPILNCRL